MFLKSIIGIFITLILCSCNGDKTFNVVVEELPSSVSRDKSNIDNVWMIFHQLNEKLFFVGKTGFSSELLSSWTAENNHKKFTFCINNDIYFSNNQKLTTDILSKNIEDFEKKKYFTESILQKKFDNNCLTIEFKNSYTGLIARLAKDDASILTPDTFDSDKPIGISPYEISFFSKDKITLTLNKTSKAKYFTKINYFSISNSEANKKEIHEINHLRDENRIKFITDKYNKHNLLQLVSRFIVLNITDANLRKQVWNCIDASKFYRAMYENDNSSKETSSFLPKGMPGYQDVKLIRKCTQLNKKNNLRYLNIYESKLKVLIDFFSSLKNKNLQVEVINKTIEQAASIVFSEPIKKYDLIYLSISGNDPLTYLSYFTNRNFTTRLTNEPVSELLKNIEKVNRTSNFSEYEKLLSDMNYDLIKNAWVIPVSQENREYYYPKNLKGINLDYTQDISNYKIKDLYISE